MSSYNQQQAPTAGQAYPTPAEGYPSKYVAPPPAGYPVKDGANSPDQKVPIETKSRDGDDSSFWEGCCAALCCCCVLETCF